MDDYDMRDLPTFEDISRAAVRIKEGTCCHHESKGIKACLSLLLHWGMCSVSAFVLVHTLVLVALY